MVPGMWVYQMIVGCYSVDLYCDNWFDHPDGTRYTGHPNRKPHVYTGETEAGCLRQAKHDGWRITRAANKGDRKSYCPACSGKKRR